MSSDSDVGTPAQCEGNHDPTCPNRLVCSCLRSQSTEDDAITVLLQEERRGVLDVNAVGGRYKRTSLLISCENNWLRLVVMLMDKRADVNKTDKYRSTPLIISCSNDNLELARLLLDKGADYVNKA